MICVELELIADIRDFTTLFYVNLRGKSFEWLESSIESDLACNREPLLNFLTILLSSNTLSTCVRTGN